MIETKVCNICKKEKPLEQYSWRNKKKGIKHGHCKDCHREYRHQHYRDNQEKYIEMARLWDEENKIEYLNTNRRYVLEYLLKHPCVDCGEKNPLVLEFDHVRGKKLYTISEMLDSVYSLENIKREIAKCEVRCANCHRRKTAKDWDWKILSVIEELCKEHGL